MKFSRRMKIGLLGVVIAAVIIIPVYAYSASNTLHFNTTLGGNPFELSVLNNYNARNVLPPPYLPAKLHYEESVTLMTSTNNTDNTAYNDVRTNYKIWRTDVGAMEVSWVTVHVYDYNHATGFDLAFTKQGDGSLTASIGPYSTTAGFNADANVTVTFHSPAPVSVEYQADVWVTVG